MADLLPKQDPMRMEFWNDPKDMVFRSTRITLTNRKGITWFWQKTRQKVRPFSKGERFPVVLGSGGGVNENMPNKSSVATDLLTTLGCLGHFRTAALSFSKMKLKRTPPMRRACSSYWMACYHFEIKKKKGPMDIGKSNRPCPFRREHWRRGRPLPKLSKYSAYPTKPAGWFGYESLKMRKRDAPYGSTPTARNARNGQRFAKDNHLTVDDADADFAIRVSPENNGSTLHLMMSPGSNGPRRLSDEGFRGMICRLANNNASSDIKHAQGRRNRRQWQVNRKLTSWPPAPPRESPLQARRQIHCHEAPKLADCNESSKESPKSSFSNTL